jgi:hypothetical protein
MLAIVLEFRVKKIVMARWDVLYFFVGFIRAF